MMIRLRSNCPFACLFSLALFALADCSLQPALAATDDEVFSTLDANEDGVLSGKEAATVRQFDADQDGEVTKDEYLAGIVSEQKQQLSINDDKLFAERDTNEDGVLSGTEIKGFEKYDADSDGEVSRQEFDQGRAADRRKLAEPSEEQTRLLREMFRTLDTNEDGRLSGKEMVGYEQLDLDGDRRISEKEYLAGDPAADPLDVFLEMIRTSDPTKFLKATDPVFAQQIDRPVLKFIMEHAAGSLGALEPSAQDALRPKRETINDQPHTVYRGQLEFKEGKADATLIVARGRIVGFSLDAPVLNDVGDRLLSALTTNREFGKSIANFYTPRCEEFIRLILAGEDDNAFAKYHPEVQQQLGREKVLNVFEVFRTKCGTFKGFELESMQVIFDGDGKGENYKLTHLVRGSKQDYLATTTLQFVGLAAHIVGLAAKPAEAGPDSPPPQPAELNWVKVPATVEGVTFEMPTKPKRTADESKQQVVYSVEDKSFVWSVRIEPYKKNLKAKAFFDAFQKGLITELEGELLDQDEADVGDHPARMFVLKLKDSVMYAEQTVIVGSRLYRFQMITTEQDQGLVRKVLRYFFESVKFPETDDDVPAPPEPPNESGSAAPPAPPVAPPEPPPLSGGKAGEIN